MEIKPPKITLTKQTRKALRFIQTFDHDHKEACTCTDLIDGLEEDMKEITAALTAIRQFAVDIRKHPTDIHGVVDYSSGRIIQIIDYLSQGKDQSGKNNLG